MIVLRLAINIINTASDNKYVLKWAVSIGMFYETKSIDSIVQLMNKIVRFE